MSLRRTRTPLRLTTIALRKAAGQEDNQLIGVMPEEHRSPLQVVLVAVRENPAAVAAVVEVGARADRDGVLLHGGVEVLQQAGVAPGLV